MTQEKTSLSSSTLATLEDISRNRSNGTLSSSSKSTKLCIHNPIIIFADVKSSRFVSLLFAHIGAALALFLATTDATIVSTSLPTIASELNASSSQYSWVGVAYMLTQTACQPIYPIFSRLLGRKNALWLIVARSFQGMGAGGIVNSIWVLTSEIVTPSEKHKWSQALSLTWSASAIAGPLLGGVFIYMNIPVGFVAFFLLYWSLRFFKLPEIQPFSWVALRSEFAHNFDFIGVFLLVSGTACTVLGLSLAGQLSCTFYLALYFQAVLGVGPLLCGVLMLPYSLGSALASIPVALFNDYYSKRTKDTRCYKLVIISGLGLSTLGFGKCSPLRIQCRVRNKSPLILKEVYPLVAGIGIGMLFHAPFAAITNGMASQDRASTTSAFFLVRFIGATSGLSMAGAIFEGRLSKTLPENSPLRGTSFSNDLRKLVHIKPLTLRMEILHDVSSALSLSFWIRIRSIETETNQDETQTIEAVATVETKSV
ncbi:hypothetical protein Clacol_003684 [Clathrus columnatus]|uniref:Major facilitator superfamily (MFS) profile domain-containing protein n=1 Tax=Clathrus columnatus TaxID=1419009 RepID=A0AAV5A8W9_9AGAM|nr:hypothetical protein Clacol_003684 [Clathrus columnatus]